MRIVKYPVNRNYLLLNGSHFTDKIYSFCFEQDPVLADAVAARFGVIRTVRVFARMGGISECVERPASYS